MIIFAVADDPVGRLSDYLDALGEHLSDVDTQVHRERHNRLSLLHLHALAGILIAPAFASIGRAGMAGPTWAVARQIPGAPYSLAALLFIGALILGLATSVRNLHWEAIGVGMLLTWYLTIAVSFAGAILLWALQGQPEGSAKPSFYAPLVYAHLAAVMIVHMLTLRTMTQARRRAL